MPDTHTTTLFHAALRVWQKYGRPPADWSDWPAWVALGDALYHASDGAEGQCGLYDGPRCKSWERYAAEHGDDVRDTALRRAYERSG